MSEANGSCGFEHAPDVCAGGVQRGEGGQGPLLRAPRRPIWTRDARVTVAQLLASAAVVLTPLALAPHGGPGTSALRHAPPPKPQSLRMVAMAPLMMS